MEITIFAELAFEAKCIHKGNIGAAKEILSAKIVKQIVYFVSLFASPNGKQ